MTFTTVLTYEETFNNTTSDIKITVKDISAQTFINAKLINSNKTGAVTIGV